MLHLQKIFWTNIHPTFLGSLIHQSQVKTGRLQKIYCHSNLFTSQQKMDKFVTRKPTESDSSEEEASLPSKRRITRLRFSEHEKERYGKMSLHDKRKLYKCGSEYETIQNIPTWSEEAAESGKCVSLKQEAKGETYLADDTINSKVSVWRGDITRCEIDAIVNAANETLLGGGGVDGAIHSAAGPYLKSECATLKGCETGDAKITLGYNLPAKYVIHTVGPKGENPVKLESCYNRSLACMKEYELRSIAFPCISTGIYGYPNHAAAKVALKTVRTFLEENKDEVDRVIFCLFLPVDIKLYNQYMMEYFPPEKEDD